MIAAEQAAEEAAAQAAAEAAAEAAKVKEQQEAGQAAATQTAAVAGTAAAASVASSAASGGSSFDGAWNVINSFQLLIVLGLLEIEYPPKVEAFFQGFSFTMFSVPERLNQAQQNIPSAELEDGETSDRF